MEKTIRPRDLEKKRREIDSTDRQLLTLLNQRVRLALGIRKIKKRMGKKIYDPKREQEVLEKLIIRNRGPLKEEDLSKIFRTIIKVCRKAQNEVPSS